MVAAWRAGLVQLVDSGDRSIETVRTYERGIWRFLEWCADNEYGPVTRDTVLRWKADEKAQGNAPGAINTWLAGIKSFFRWASENDLITSNPTKGVAGSERKEANKYHRRSKLEDAEVLRLLDAPRGESPKAIRDRAILHLYAYTAMRTVELYRANVEDMRVEKGHNVLEVMGKGAQQSTGVVIPRAAYGPLTDWLAVRSRVTPAKRDRGPLFVSLSNNNLGGRLSLKSYRELVKGYMAAVGIVDQRKTTHSLRHAAITKLVRTVGPVRAMEVSRHSRLDTVMIYYHEDERYEDPPEEYISYQQGE